MLTEGERPLNGSLAPLRAPPYVRRVMLTPLASTVLLRVVAGAALSALVALLARRAGSLSRSGATAAVFVGTAAVSAGWTWGALLLAYFVASSALSRLGRAKKERRTSGVVAKGGNRDARQVLANGGAFALGTLLVTLAPGVAGSASLAALGALAAATADTWATEVGTLVGGTPRSLLTARPVPPGTSGGVSLAGSVAMIAGALFVALVAAALGITRDVALLALVTLAGTVGALGDSIIGATMQERRWCDACARATERRVHDCGATTRLAGGREWMDNDVVNLAATLIGAAVAAALYRG